MGSTVGPTEVMRGPRRMLCHSPAWSQQASVQRLLGHSPLRWSGGRVATDVRLQDRLDSAAESPNPSAVPTGEVPTGEVPAPGKVCWAGLYLALVPGFKLLGAASVWDIDKQPRRVTGGLRAALAMPGWPGYTPAGRGPQRCCATQN